jgi:hypothetical protein
MSTRWQRVHQLTQDVIISNNVATVIGILGLPINTVGGTQGTIPVFDNSGSWINLLSVLPIENIPSIPGSLITDPNFEPQFNYRFQGGV